MATTIDPIDTGTNPVVPPVATTAPAPIVPPPTDPAELAIWLNDQQNAENAQGYDPFNGRPSGEVIDEFMTGDALGMQGEAPTMPKFEETFQKLRTDMGIESVEAGINEYKKMIREQESLLMQQKNYERGKANRLGVIEGRVDQATRDRQEQISWLSSNVSYLTDVANSAYNYINMTMKFKEMDYNTAKEAYDTEFNQRLGIYQMLQTEAKEERDYQMRLKQQQQQVASAQLSMYADMITTGKMQWNKMSETEQLAIHKLEVQAGLPIGFVSKITIPKGSTVKSVTQHTDANGTIWADTIFVDPITGKVSVVNTKIGKTAVTKTSSGGGGSGTTQAQKTAQKLSAAYAQFDKAFNGYKIIDTGNSSKKAPLLGKDGKVSPDTYKELRSEWVKKGLDGKKFDEAYSKYVNPSHWQDYGSQLKTYFGEGSGGSVF